MVALQKQLDDFKKALDSQSKINLELKCKLDAYKESPAGKNDYVLYKDLVASGFSVWSV